MSLLESLDQLLLVLQVEFVLAEVLRTDILDLSQFLVICLSEVFSLLLCFKGDTVDVVFHLFNLCVELGTELLIYLGQFSLLRLLLGFNLIFVILKLLDSVLLNLRYLVGKLFLLATDLLEDSFTHFLHAEIGFLQAVSNSLDVPLTLFDQVFLFVDVVNVLGDLLSMVLKFLDVLLLSVALIFPKLAYAGI